MKWTILRLFGKTPPGLDFPPLYPTIADEDIPPASCLLFLRKNGNRLTQMAGNKLYRHPFIPDFHAATKGWEDRVVNVGITTRLTKLEKLKTSTTRIDVIQYKRLTPDRAKAVLDFAYDQVGDLYDWRGYLNKGTRFIIGLKHWIKPDPNSPFCSELHAEAFEKFAFKVSPLPFAETAPWDLRSWAMAHPDDAGIFTYFVGQDFGA